MTMEPPVAVVEGPKGAAEIYELWVGGRLIDYEVHFAGKADKYVNIGEAYIAAGEKVGTKT